MYEQVKKPTSSWSPTVQKKSSKFGPQPYKVQPKLSQAPKEMPAYTPLATDWITDNPILRSLEAASAPPQEESEGENSIQLATESETIQRQEESPQPEISSWTSPIDWVANHPLMRSVEPIPLKPQPTTTVQTGAEAGTIQRVCSECEAQLSEQEEKQPIQTKLTVGAPGDHYEQEADRVAAQVMTMPDSSPQVQRFPLEDNPVQMRSLAESITPLVQRQVDESVQMHPLLQRSIQGDLTQGSGDLESRLNASKGGGSPLASEVQAFMEPRFGADFSGVRVHTGGEAVQMNRQLGAQAFTHGSDVYFGAGKSPGNNELTAHELTHVVQQTGGQVRRSVIQRVGGDQSPAQSTAGFTGDVAGNLDILYKEAEVAQKELYEKVTKVAGETGGEAKLPSSLKGRERAMEKVMADYKGDASKLVDIARGSIVYNSYADLMGGIDICNKNLTLVREKNRFAEPTPAGYRDILLNVKLSNGHIAELQLHLTQILAVKSGAGHKIYEEVRKIEAAAQTADRALTSEERAKIEKLNAESKVLYDQALASAGG